MDEDEMAGLAARIGAFSLKSVVNALNPFGGGGRRAPRGGGFGQFMQPRAATPQQPLLYPGGYSQYPSPPVNQFSYPPQGGVPWWAQGIVPNMPGTPTRQEAILGSAFPLFSFTNATGTNSITQQMNPQAVMRGRRLVCTVLRNGATAAQTAPLITNLQVGMVPCILTPDGVSADSYAPNAVDTNVLLPATAPGVLYVMTMRLPVALGVGDTITVIASLQASSIA